MGWCNDGTPHRSALIVAEDEACAERKLAEAIGVEPRPGALHVCRWWRGAWRDVATGRRVKPVRWYELPEP